MAIAVNVIDYYCHFRSQKSYILEDYSAYVCWIERCSFKQQWNYWTYIGS